MNIKILVIFNVLAATGFELDQTTPAPKQPSKPFFEVLIDTFEETFNDNNYVKFDTIKARRVNKTRAVFGKVTILKPIDNECMFEVQSFQKQGGEFRLMPFRILPEPFCTFAGNDIYLYPDLANSSDFPLDLGENCPLQPGEYNLNGVVFRLEKVPRNIVPSGYYALEISLKKDDILVVKFRVYGSVNNI